MDNIQSNAYRENGAIGALLDEYQKAVFELKSLVKTISDSQLIQIVDHDTKDVDCRSVQSILTHVLRSGFCYIIYIRNSQGEQLPFVEKKKLDSIEAYSIALTKMFLYAEQLFKDYPNIELECFDRNKKMKTNWNQYYDVEQLMEHAIVHILRHRRQIERFKIILDKV